MPADFIRIISDIHYGERSSRVESLAQLRPLCLEPAALVLNGDTLDTRPGPYPERSARFYAEVREFFASVGPPVTFITGNHDPDFTSHHSVELANGTVLALHGDLLFEGIVPWGRDAGPIRRRVREELAALPPESAGRLEDRLLAFRRVASKVRQRHQSEPHGFKYLAMLAMDTAWPPWRIGNILLAWVAGPGRAAELARRHRPKARFVVFGHTHRPGIWRYEDGLTAINTGSFCRPLGARAVDISEGRLVVRRVERRGAEFHAGPVVAEFSLATGSGLGN